MTQWVTAFFKRYFCLKKAVTQGVETDRSNLRMANRRRRRGRMSGDDIVLNFHEFASELGKHRGSAKVQKMATMLEENNDLDIDIFDGRIALLETKHGAPKNVYQTKYYHVCQILNHKLQDGDHCWTTQTWNQSGDKEKNGKCDNHADDLFLLPKNNSVITYDKQKKNNR